VKPWWVVASLVVASSLDAQVATPPRGVFTLHTVDMRPEIRAGTVDEHQIPSKIYDRRRRVWVYTPSDYDPNRAEPYDLIVAFDGADYLDAIPLPMILDTLIAARKIPSFIAVLVDDSVGVARLQDLANQPRFAEFVGDEVVPWVRRYWNVTRDPRRSIVTGASAGALAAAYVALERPNVFGAVIAQSGAFWRGPKGAGGPPWEWLTSQYKARPRQPLRFVVDVGELETQPAAGVGPTTLEVNRRFRDALRASGYAVAYTEVTRGKHAPETWKLRLPQAIVTLAGKGPGQ
jgi:enterochelin esterase-like enzyme